MNVEKEFLKSAAEFLKCIGGTILFRYPGLSIGTNPKSSTTWQPIFEAVERKLALWKVRRLSFGMRVTLINSVLNSLPIYFLSFKKL